MCVIPFKTPILKQGRRGISILVADRMVSGEIPELGGFV